LKARFIALNILLLAGIGAVVWQARARWSEAREEQLGALGAKAKPGSLPPLGPEPKPEAPPATKYLDVATKDLFSKDRNPTVVIEPPAAEKPKVMPHLPVVYGVLGLPSGVKALMAEKADGPSKSVRAGDTIGEFKIASLDQQMVVFSWDGREITRKIEDLMDRSSHSGAASVPAPAPAPVNQFGQAAMQPGAAPQPVQNPPAPSPNPSRMGIEVGTASRSERVCVPGDTTPAGTVVDGYRKVVFTTLIGPNCRWVAVQ
jgi:hypothetical protein